MTAPGFSDDSDESTVVCTELQDARGETGLGSAPTSRAVKIFKTR